MKEAKGAPVHVRPSLKARKRIDYAKQRFGLSESGFLNQILEDDLTRLFLEKLKLAQKQMLDEPVP